MKTRRTIGNLLAVIGLMLASFRPDSTLMGVLRYLALGYISIDFVLQARAGYLRRRPHWTRESWRRYLTACAVPVGAIAIVVCMLIALEWRLPILGAAYSTTRQVWGLASVVFLVVGAGGVAAAVECLSHGDATRQFAWPAWISRGRGSAA